MRAQSRGDGRLVSSSVPEPPGLQLGAPPCSPQLALPLFSFARAGV